MAGRKIHLNAFTMNCVGHLSTGLWRYPGDQSHRYTDLDYWTDLARIAERGRFDAVFFADVSGVYDVYTGRPDPAIRNAVQTPANNPLLLVSAMADATDNLGFATTYSATYTHPYRLARDFSTLDHLTDGRIAWNVVTSYLDSAARNLGLDGRIPHDERYDRAEEYMDVCYALWEDSWEDDAVVRDAERGVYADPEKVHPIDHEGEHFAVPGPHVCEPSPQRTPVLYQAGQSDRGREFAATHAEAVFTVQPNAELARDYVEDVRRRAADAGRDPDGLLVFSGVVPIVGETETIAREKYESYREHVSSEGAMALIGGWTDIDFSTVDPDSPIEEIETDAVQGVVDSFAKAGTGETTTVRDAATAGGLGGGLPRFVGTPEAVADEFEYWFEDVGVDGFNLAEVVRPGTVEDFVELVVPELQARGLLREEYEGDTLREVMFGDGPRLSPDHPGRRGGNAA